MGTALGASSVDADPQEIRARHPGAVGLLIVVFAAIVAIVGPWIALYPATSSPRTAAERGAAAAGLRLFPAMPVCRTVLPRGRTALQDELGHAVACRRWREVSTFPEPELVAARKANKSAAAGLAD
jgi:hypothetical protein